MVRRARTDHGNSVLNFYVGISTCLRARNLARNGALLKKNLGRRPKFCVWSMAQIPMGNSGKTYRGFGDRGPNCDARFGPSQIWATDQLVSVTRPRAGKGAQLQRTPQPKISSRAQLPSRARKLTLRHAASKIILGGSPFQRSVHESRRASI